MPSEPILSRHRLPRFYRVALATLWLLPITLLVGTLLVSHGWTLALLDPRLVLPLLLMGLPALYIWHEGVDVLPSGIIARVHVPHYYAYDELGTWYLDAHSQRRILTVWDAKNDKVVEYHAAHLTDLPRLLAALKQHVRYRNFPY